MSTLLSSIIVLAVLHSASAGLIFENTTVFVELSCNNTELDRDWCFHVVLQEQDTIADDTLDNKPTVTCTSEPTYNLRLHSYGLNSETDYEYYVFVAHTCTPEPDRIREFKVFLPKVYTHEMPVVYNITEDATERGDMQCAALMKMVKKSLHPKFYERLPCKHIASKLI